MSKLLTLKDLAPAHVNALTSQLHALEVSLTILKQLVNGANEEGSSEQSESPPEAAKPPKPAKAPKAPKASSFEDEETEEAPAEETEETEEADDDFAPKAPAKKAKAPQSFDDEEEEEAPPAKKPAKAPKEKKLTLDDINSACYTRAARTNRAEVLGILKTKFKVKSVTDLKEEDYAKVIAAMKG